MLMSDGVMASSSRAGLPTVSGDACRSLTGSEPPRLHGSGGSEDRGAPAGVEGVGFVNGGSSCALNSVIAILLRLPGSLQLGGTRSDRHPFISHYLDPAVMVTQPRSVSAEFARLARALHADWCSDSGMLVAPAPLCTAQLRTALASYAVEAGMSDRFSTVGPVDAADTTEVLLSALREQWRSMQPIAQADPTACAACATSSHHARELVAQAVAAPYAWVCADTELRSFKHGLWVRVPAPPATARYTVALQRLLSRCTRTTLPTVYTVEIARTAALGDLCAQLARAARLPEGAVLVVYSVVDGQLW